MFFQAIFTLAMLATGGWVLLRGGADERAGWTILFVASLASLIAEMAGGIAWGVAPVDIACFVAFFVLMLRSQRFWPIWATALQASTVLAHPIAGMSPLVHPWVYASATVIWSYGILAAIALGCSEPGRISARSHG